MVLHHQDTLQVVLEKWKIPFTTPVLHMEVMRKNYVPVPVSYYSLIWPAEERPSQARFTRDFQTQERPTMK